MSEPEGGTEILDSRTSRTSVNLLSGLMSGRGGPGDVIGSSLSDPGGLFKLYLYGIGLAWTAVDTKIWLFCESVKTMMIRRQNGEMIKLRQNKRAKQDETKGMQSSVPGLSEPPPNSVNQPNFSYEINSKSLFSNLFLTYTYDDR